MTNKKDNAVVEGRQQFSFFFKTFPRNQKAFSKQILTNMFP